MTDRNSDLQKFYALLARLETRLQGARLLARCGGHMGWPRRGVYFFFEPGELRSDGRSRVVRVGTHALKAGAKSTLWKRLSQHRGAVSGAGNHRGSIFRLLVGDALIKSGKRPSAVSWGIGSDASSAAKKLGISPEQVRRCERPLEVSVSEHICSMPFLWIDIDDEPGPASARGEIERNCIALLSNHDKPAIDPPSAKWLGSHCGRERVRSSGLWNSNYVDGRYDPVFLASLERYVESTNALQADAK